MISNDKKLFEILNKALTYANISMDAFKRYQETNDAYDWNNSMEWDRRARGLLDAYEIITEREVVNIVSAVEYEISILKGKEVIK